MKNEINEIREEMEGIKDLLEDMNKKLDKINNTIEIEVKESCTKMGEHIDFVEVVYNKIKAPLSYLCWKVKYLITPDDNINLLDKQDKFLEETPYYLIND